MTRTALKRISLQSLLAAVGALLMLWVGIRQWQEVRNDAQLELSEADEPTIPQYDCPEQQTEGPVLGRQSDMFRDITEELGISFLHQPGPLGTWFMPESTGTGIAVLDYDRDGRTDLYFVNCAASPHPNIDPQHVRTNQLYRRTEAGTYTNVTMEAGLGDTAHGCGAAVGDVDNDGWPDVFNSNYGQDTLYRNLGNGSFDLLRNAFDQPENNWGSAACFVDFDRDGWLDLFVVNYTADPEYSHRISCGFDHGLVSYCGPHKFRPTVDRLYHNQTGTTAVGTDGRREIRFVDITETAGLGKAETYGFGAICHDLTGDGWPDFFVANDGAPNRLWVNQKNGTFVEEADLRGVSCNGAGIPEAGMGAVLGDVNHDRIPDLLLTHLTKETATLYQGAGSGFFTDVTPGTALEKITQRHTGWGVALVDLDHDGRLDIPVVNGLVIPCHSGFPFHGEDEFHRREETITDSSRYWEDYADRNVLLFGTEDSAFADGNQRGGDFTAAVASGRGLATADLDDDGDLDLIVSNCGSRARCYENRLTKSGSWLMVQLQSRHGERDAIGAEAVLHLNDGTILTGFCLPQSGYLCSNDSRIHFGLPPNTKVESIEVRWADGVPEQSGEVFSGPAVNQRVVLRQGAGKEPEVQP